MRLYLYGGCLLGDVMSDAVEIVREAECVLAECEGNADRLAIQEVIATAILRVLDGLPISETTLPGTTVRFVHAERISAVRAELEELK